MRDFLREALEALRSAGIYVAGGTLQDWELGAPHSRAVVREVTVVEGPLTAKKLDHLQSHAVSRRVYIAGTADTEVLAAAQHGYTDLIVFEPLTVFLNGQVYFPAPEQSKPLEKPSKFHGRPRWMHWAVLRVLLLAREPLLQKDISQLVGVTSQAVSKTFRSLEGLVMQTSGGWVVIDPVGLLALWEAEYPGPGGLEIGWYGLQEPMDQAEQAASLAEDLEAFPLISGDPAADTYAPWRLPQIAVLYLRSLVDFAGEGFTPAPIDRATMRIRVPADPTVWATAENTPGSSHLLADPLLVLWETIHQAAPDGDEAAQKLRKHILGRHLERNRLLEPDVD